MVASDAERESGSWWEREPLRLLQPNLRETDADLDVDALFASVERFDATALLLNTGGVCAFYPTDLDYHPRAGPLAARPDGDLVGAVTERCREEGVRYVARFDFSKAHESVFDERPEWFYRDADGEPVNYHGVVHTCPSGGYQQFHAFDVLEEALTRYPIDGVFFNMFGYREHDYDGTYHGPCHCGNCRERFAEYGGDLPPREYDDDHPDYRAFKRETADELLDRVRDLVSGLDREVAVATYSEAADAVTDESNTAVDRPLPRWRRSAADNVAAVQDTYGKPAWNICINAVDIPYRFQGVSTAAVSTRLYGALTRGGGLAFCVNGAFATYPDPTNFDAVEEAYGIHAAHEDVYAALEPVADVVLVRPDGDRRAYRGWFRALAERHVPFHVRTERGLGHPESRPLAGYDAIVVPGAGLDEERAAALADANDAGAGLLIAGARAGTDALLGRLGATRGRVRGGDDVRGSYVATVGTGDPTRAGDAAVTGESDGDGEDLASAFAALPGMVAVDGAFAEVAFDAETALPFVRPGTFGPPERVGREGLTPTEHPGIGRRAGDGGRGAACYLPWAPGRLYHDHGFDTHGRLLAAALDVVRTTPRRLVTDVSPTVDVALGRLPEGHLLQLLDRGGRAGESSHEPPALEDLTVGLRGVDGPAEVLVGDGNVGVIEGVEVADRSEGVTVRLDRLERYAAVRLG